MKRLGLLLLIGCAMPTEPEGAVRITPPPEYRVWWEASRACINKREWRRWDQVEWYLTPEMVTANDGRRVVALTRGHRIYLWDFYAQQSWVIQHELAHAINALRADPHPADPFVTCDLMRWRWEEPGAGGTPASTSTTNGGTDGQQPPAPE